MPGFTAEGRDDARGVWPRFPHAADSATSDKTECLLANLRAAADEEDLTTVAELAPALLDLAQSLG